MLDSFTLEGAQALAIRINDYWAKRGRLAECAACALDIRYQPKLRTAKVYGVASTMRNGLPIKRATPTLVRT